ncbi:hypothetical protein MMC28_002449 [Mycoblastus sanguinarius]|nr:hypothetical protein [Mycoblastus sanguinarius]
MTRVRGYNSSDNGLEKTLEHADVVIFSVGPAGRFLPVLTYICRSADSPVIPGFTSRDNLFKSSAAIVGEIAKEHARVCPAAIMLLISNPINAIVPFAAEVLRAYKAFDPRKILGLTTLDVVRAETFIAEAERNRTGEYAKIHVVGGHSPETIIPLFSQAEPPIKVSGVELERLSHRISHGGREVYFAKYEKGAAALSTAYAALRLTESLCKALRGEKGIVECSFAYLPGLDGGREMAEALGIDYFAAPIELGTQGAERIVNPLPKINATEQQLVKTSIPYLQKSIETGLDAARDLVPLSAVL